MNYSGEQIEDLLFDVFDFFYYFNGADMLDLAH